MQGLYATGELSRHAAAAFGAGARHYATQAELIEALRQEMQAGDELTVLVKGSRRAQMEKVVAALLDGKDAHAPHAGED